MATKLFNASEDKISPLTMRARWADPCMGNWLCATQYWTWKGGDAVVVPSDDYLCYVAIRFGTTVKVVKARGFNHACEQVGVNPDKFVVTCRETV